MGSTLTLHIGTSSLAAKAGRQTAPPFEHAPIQRGAPRWNPGWPPRPGIASTFRCPPSPFGLHSPAPPARVPNAAGANRIESSGTRRRFSSQPGSLRTAAAGRSDRPTMSYAYLFKYIIIGDTGPSRSPLPLPNPPLILRSPQPPGPARPAPGGEGGRGRDWVGSARPGDPLLGVPRWPPVPVDLCARR